MSDHSTSLDSTHHQTSRNDDYEREASYTPDIAAHIDREPEPENAFSDPADSFNLLLTWVSTSNSVHSAGLRVLALLMLCRPELMDAHTTREIAKRYKTSPQALSKYTAEVFRLTEGRFHRGDWMRTAKTREAYRQRALRVHNLRHNKEQT